MMRITQDDQYRYVHLLQGRSICYLAFNCSNQLMLGANLN